MIPDWPTERRKMIEKQLRRRGIRDERVLGAMLEIPREQFVPMDVRVLSYADSPVDIGCGQTISQPYMTALMSELLELNGTENVLEIGAGCGYAAAVLGTLAGRVVTVEIIPRLAETARCNLQRGGRNTNIQVLAGDGLEPARGFAPYDAISVAAAAPDVPAALLDLLNDPGTLVIPVGDREQELRVIRKEGGRIESRVATMCRFVPLRGKEGFH